MTIRDRKGNETVIDVDEHPRPGTSVESLSALRPILSGSIAGATVTAGNSSGQNDAGSDAIVTTREKAEELGSGPYGRLVSWSLVGVEPERMGIGPVPAVVRALRNAELTWGDIDLIEINEAFAVQVLACFREWGFGQSELDRANVNGSGISLGHPVGATGGGILANLLRKMKRLDARFGLETMCIGGGQGLAAVFERVEK